MSVDSNFDYLKRIFFLDFPNFISSFKNVKQAADINEYAKSMFYGMYDDVNVFQYTTRDSKFDLIHGLNKNNERVVILEYTACDDSVPYKKIYKEKTQSNEYFVQSYWKNGKEMIQWFVVLKYGNEERTMVRKTHVFDTNKLNTNDFVEETITRFTRTRKWINRNYMVHRSEDQPAETCHRLNMSMLVCQKWYNRGKLHRSNNPAELVYDEKNRIKKEAHYQNDKKHCITGPSELYYNYNDKNIIRIWCQNDELLATDTVKI